MSDCAEAIRLDPSYVRAYVERASVCLDWDFEWDEPDDPKVIDQCQPENILKDLRTALRLDPEDPCTSEADGHLGFTQKPLGTDQIVTRQFTSFSQAAEEAGESRVLGGIHFTFDHTAGNAAGRAVGQWVVGRFLGPRN
jgi:hypothetical protein